VTDSAEVAHVLAAEFEVAERAVLDRLLTEQVGALGRLGARRLVVYSALRDPGRVFVTLGIRHRRPLEAVLRSPWFFTWFDALGLTDIPPIFAGESVQKVRVAGGEDQPATDHGSVVVAAVVPVGDPARLLEQIRARADRFREAGVRQVWVYRAHDSGREVMILQEIDTEEHAERWIDHPDDAASWMAEAGVGVYPPLFVGRVDWVLTLDEQAQG
jgi:hypothetical protein